MISLVVSYPISTSYCASFDASHSGVNGYFAMTIDESTGLSYYNFKVDLVNYEYFTTICPSIGNGLKYHIHSYWTNTTASNTDVTSSCLATGGHFDPAFACGSSSQYQISPKLCPLLNRTAPAYTYSCSASNFAAGNLFQCEVGDLSGKFGAVKSTTPVFDSSSLSSSGVLSDPLGPTITTYLQSQTTTDYTNMWSSIVFHCPDTNNTRLFCAQLTTSLQSCVSQDAAFAPSSTSDTSKTYSAKTFNTSVTVGVIIAFVIGALASFLFISYKAKKQSKGLLDKGVNDPLIQNY